MRFAAYDTLTSATWDRSWSLRVGNVARSSSVCRLGDSEALHGDSKALHGDQVDRENRSRRELGCAA